MVKTVWSQFSGLLGLNVEWPAGELFNHVFQEAHLIRRKRPVMPKLPIRHLISGGIITKCHLCFDIRLHLVRGHQIESKELQPQQFYEQAFGLPRNHR